MFASRRPFSILVVLSLSLVGSHLRAQHCWVYVDEEFEPDDEFVPTAILCVEDGDLVTPCSWNENCHNDDDTSDCCTSIPDTPGSQTVREMHVRWHQCFGNVGASDGDNPPARGQRWYAFHRQIEFDFNRWREGFLPKIESLQWCQGMILPEGHGGAGLDPDDDDDNHLAGCGEGDARPHDTTCVNCIPFPACLFIAGAGPTCEPSVACPDCVPIDPGPCQADDVSFPYDELEDFANVEEISVMLDDYFHGQMHGAVADGDEVSWGDHAFNNNDAANPTCSVRDPMFWRLHKALDDVVRAWQEVNAVDVMVVIDRSGSMDDLDSGGVLTKLEASFEAAQFFAAILGGAVDGGPNNNRIGIVSYDGNALLHLPLTHADTLDVSDPTDPFNQALDDIAMSSRGCTSIGGGILRALEELCDNPGDPGNCQEFIAADPDANARRAILLLTDGLENRPPCIQREDAAPGGCGGVCRSTDPNDQLDFSRLEYTQVASVGFGSSGSLNGDLLTLLAERQGGIYMQNPNTDPENDLKQFFTKAFGELTDQFPFNDPNGFLPANQPVSEAVVYDSCGFDQKVTFASGWKRATPERELRLLVTSPEGDLVREVDASVTGKHGDTWAYRTVHFPFRGQSNGPWRARLIRPHQFFVNGFTTDSFADPEEGVSLIRQQIQRLCPDGCESVLYFEDGRLGDTSAYEKAIDTEVSTGLLNSATATSDADEFAAALRRQWDLIVYAYQLGPDAPQPYDNQLAGLLCKGQRAIITDTRLSAQGHILECAGVQRETRRIDRVDQRQLDGSGQIQSIHSRRSVGQTFTVGSVGLLSGIELSLLGQGREELVVEILDFSRGDLTNATVLGAVSVPPQNIGGAPAQLDPGAVTATKIDLTPMNIRVHPGDRLAFRLSTSRVLPASYGLRVALGDLYARGQYFVGETLVADVDAAFKVFLLDDGTNWISMTGDGRLVDGVIAMQNPGYPAATFGLVSFSPANTVQATAVGGPAAIVVRTTPGADHHWFVDVLGRGLSRLAPHAQQSFWKTGDDLVATVRVLPSYIRAGGYDHVDARVVVEYPLTGIGNLLTENGLGDEIQVGGELLDRRASTLRGLRIPTATETFPLFDDGTNGDQYAGNYYWSGVLTDLGRVDGMHKYRFILEFTVDDCTVRREIAHSTFVDVRVDPGSSDVEPGPSRPAPNGGVLTSVRILPRDIFGNFWGPGRPPVGVDCGPTRECLAEGENETIVDNEDGSYTLSFVTAPDVGGVRIHAFGANFDLSLPCADCPQILALDVDMDTLREHDSTTGVVRLSGPALAGGLGGALVYLDTDREHLLDIPTAVLVPAGQDSAVFPIEVGHLERGEDAAQVSLAATYRAEVERVSITVLPESKQDGPRFVRGDVDSNSAVELTDGIALLNNLFLGGPAPLCMDAADTNDSGGDGPDLSDSITIFNWLFLGGPAPQPPSPQTPVYRRESCGIDPTEDGMDCRRGAATCEPME